MIVEKTREEKLKEAVQAIYAITLDSMNKTRSGMKSSAVGKIQKICKNVLGVKYREEM